MNSTAFPLYNKLGDTLHMPKTDVLFKMFITFHFHLRKAFELGNPLDCLFSSDEKYGKANQQQQKLDSENIIYTFPWLCSR